MLFMELYHKHLIGSRELAVDSFRFSPLLTSSGIGIVEWFRWATIWFQKKANTFCLPNNVHFVVQLYLKPSEKKHKKLRKPSKLEMHLSGSPF